MFLHFREDIKHLMITQNNIQNRQFKSKAMVQVPCLSRHSQISVQMKGFAASQLGTTKNQLPQCEILGV